MWVIRRRRGGGEEEVAGEEEEQVEEELEEGENSSCFSNDSVTLQMQAGFLFHQRNTTNFWGSPNFDSFRVSEARSPLGSFGSSSGSSF